MKRIEEIIDLIEITGDKCVILHKERGAYVVMKMDDYRELIEISYKITQKKVKSSDFSRPEADIREFEIRQQQNNLSNDKFYTEPVDE